MLEIHCVNCDITETVTEKEMVAKHMNHFLDRIVDPEQNKKDSAFLAELLGGER